MAPNKFEKHIRKQLEGREIEPTANAWANLSEKLDIAPSQKKRDYLWYGIAASFIGILIISLLYFGLNDAENLPAVQVVEIDETIKEDITNSELILEKNANEGLVEKSKIKPLAKRGVKDVIKNQPLELKGQITSIKEKEAVVNLELEKVVVAKDFKEEIISAKILEIVSKVDSLEQNNEVLTDVEVDKLLRDAQEELLRDKLFKNNSSVDAMALLKEVEVELEQSFRDQIFQSLKTGFLKVRTAVADRNN